MSVSNTMGGAVNTAVEPSTNQKNSAIYWWAGIGVFFALMNIWVYGSATIAGDFMNPADPGPTPIPEWMRISFLINDTLWGIALAVTFVTWVVMPFVKNKKFSMEGLLWLGLLSVIWQDPIEGYQHMVFTYNTHALNLGGWACHIPGWVSPGGCGIAEPITWLPAFYIVCVCGMIIYGIKVADKIKVRNPSVSTFKIFFWLVVFVMVFDVIFEIGYIILGYYHYGGLALSIFPDTRFRFPIWEPILVALLFLVWALPCYYRNDKSETLAERGLSQVSGSNGKKQLLRLMAFVGIMNIGYIVGYNGPILMISMIHHHEWPEDVQNKSYFTNGLCGEGTNYPCGGSNIASARRGESIHITFDGEVVIPEGAKIPKKIPLLHTDEQTWFKKPDSTE